MRWLTLSLTIVFLGTLSLGASALDAANNTPPPSPMTARYREGTIHGFLAMSTLDGNLIADGDLLQSVHGDRITNRLTYRFKDGSLQDETTVFTQHTFFRLVSYHQVQKGPAFPHPMDLSIVAATGEVTVHTTDDKGEEKVFNEHLKLPPDLANGLVLTLLKNVSSKESAIKVSMVAATPKPRLVKLAITAQGEEPFSLGASGRKAAHYIVKVELGGIAGVVAPIIGKEPPDSSVWILGGDVPAFVKSESLSYMGGPLWRSELISPAWPKMASPDSKTADADKH